MFLKKKPDKEFFWFQWRAQEKKLDSEEKYYK